MGIRGSGAALAVALQETPASANAAGLLRGLGELQPEGTRPGRSDLAYMQHKYTPLDSRIIIITAAILLLLLAILFMNFFIRWALRRFFLLRSPKPINLNTGLSKRQVEALPSFIYSSSKPPIPTPPPPFFYPPFTFHPISSHFCHALYPTTSITSTKFGDTKLEIPSQSASTHVHNVENDPPIQFGSLEGGQLVSMHVDALDNHSPPKFCSLKVDHATEGSHPSTEGSHPSTETKEVVNNVGSIKPKAHNIYNEVKGNSPTSKGGNAIIDCAKDDEMAKHCDDNASSSAPCPICLVEFVDGETIRVLPACRHLFHIGCIDLWLAKSSSCPACRANLLEATRTPIKQSTLQVQVVTTISH